MVQPIRWLDDLSTKGGAIKAVCQQCGRVAYFDPGELLRYYQRRNWDRSWPTFADKLRCKPPAGCGAHGPTVDWVPDPPRAMTIRSRRGPGLPERPQSPSERIAQTMSDDGCALLRSALHECSTQ